MPHCCTLGVLLAVSFVIDWFLFGLRVGLVSIPSPRPYCFMNVLRLALSSGPPRCLLACIFGCSCDHERKNLSLSGWISEEYIYSEENLRKTKHYLFDLSTAVSSSRTTTILACVRSTVVYRVCVVRCLCLEARQNFHISANIYNTQNQLQMTHNARIQILSKCERHTNGVIKKRN